MHNTELDQPHHTNLYYQRNGFEQVTFSSKEFLAMDLNAKNAFLLQTFELWVVWVMLCLCSELYSKDIDSAFKKKKIWMFDS